MIDGMIFSIRSHRALRHANVECVNVFTVSTQLSANTFPSRERPTLPFLPWSQSHDEPFTKANIHLSCHLTNCTKYRVFLAKHLILPLVSHVWSEHTTHTHDTHKSLPSQCSVTQEHATSVPPRFVPCRSQLPCGSGSTQTRRRISCSSSSSSESVIFLANYEKLIKPLHAVVASHS